MKDVKEDPLSRLRPLINTLRRTFMLHVIPGREISLDEACIACRSKYARHLIMYNAKKPSGKYHFRLYVTCCAKCWYVYSFKIHSKATKKHEKNSAVFDEHSEETSSEEDEQDARPKTGGKSGKKTKAAPSALRQHVLDITKPFDGIIESIHYYLLIFLLFRIKENHQHG